MKRPCLTSGCPNLVESGRKRHCHRHDNSATLTCSVPGCHDNAIRSRGLCQHHDAYSDPDWARTHREHRALYLDWLCARCGAVDDLTLDHIDGDQRNQDPSNYGTLCRSCNSVKRGEQARARSL